MPRPNIPVEFSDRRWRINNLYTIRDKDGQRVKFRMNRAQEHLYDELSWRNIVLKARQMGFSTFIDIFILDQCLWNKDIKAGIIAHHKDDANAIYEEKIKFPYDELPDEVKQLIGPVNTDRVGHISFSNGSSIRVSTSFRSGTLQILHVSELGKIAAKYPDKAREIRTGAFEAVGKGQMIFVESTAEGAEGMFYDMCEDSRKMKEAGKKLGSLDWKFHFFPWWGEPEYTYPLDETVFTTDLIRYFDQLASRGIKLSIEQRAWYVHKLGSQKDDMTREYPSFPEEAFKASIEGSYYEREMTVMRRERRIGCVPYDPMYPVNTFWDLGMDDSMTIWFHQLVGSQNRLINYYENSGEGFEHYAKVLKDFDYNYETHYMPHDAAVRELGANARSRKESAELVGIRPILVVDRPKNTEQLLGQIEQVRTFLRTCWIDEEKCARAIVHLDKYRKDWNEQLGAYRRTPRHDQSCHGADGLRTGAVGYIEYAEYSEDELIPEAYADA